MYYGKYMTAAAFVDYSKSLAAEIPVGKDDWYRYEDLFGMFIRRSPAAFVYAQKILVKA